MRTNTVLEKEFNLSPMTLEDDPAVEEVDALAVTPESITVTRYEDLDKISEALPQVRGLESTDSELDELATYGIQAYKDLIELSLNVEQKYVGEVAGAAGNMLSHAITARTNKIKKKLDMISLQIKKQIADAKTKEVGGSDDQPVEGSGIMLDRNEMLAHLTKHISSEVKKS